ncbi:hypothetical protein CYMTET_3798 [Cymbomonas tetramitiformis]|uniref:Uncharacterized protein n=1 Tax=Cymbomonas tetramitiformis TaxID=36881 RepID=A0AAE0LKH0_9CHLO|nr:hypothetical protein CYMTET_3798 [Cymbomonas tetramitiformis]
MTGLNAVEVPRTEEIEQGEDLEHGPDKLRGRQLLSFFADYGWYVGRVMGCRSHSVVGHLFTVCYTDGDKEELTWHQLGSKLLPTAPVSEEEAGIGEWAHAVNAAAQAPPSSALEGDMEPQAAGGSVNNAGARIVEPTICRFDVSTLQPPLAMAGGITDVGGSAVDTTTSDDRGDHLKDRALAVAPAVEHWCHPSNPTAAPANPVTATLRSNPLQQAVSRGAPRALVEVTSADDNHKADDERPKEVTVLDPLAAVAENFAAAVKYGAPTVPVGVAATPTLPEDTAEVAGDDMPRTEAATLAARCTSAASSFGIHMAQIRDRRCQADGCTATARSGAKFCFAHGVGKRYQTDGCTKAAPGNIAFCRVQAGAKRCQADGCTKSAQGSTDYCKAHEGGKRCQADGCTKSAQGSTEYCIAHGGGKRCQADGCTKSAQGSTEYCKAHGGGKRCQADGCTKAAESGRVLHCTGEASTARLTAAIQPKAAPSITAHGRQALPG